MSKKDKRIAELEAEVFNLRVELRARIEVCREYNEALTAVHEKKLSKAGRLVDQADEQQVLVGGLSFASVSQAELTNR
jgi:hypothetical protein